MFKTPDPLVIVEELKSLNPDEMDRLELLTNINNISYLNASIFYTLPNLLRNENVVKIDKDNMKMILTNVIKDTLLAIKLLNSVETQMGLENIEFVNINVV